MNTVPPSTRPDTGSPSHPRNEDAEKRRDTQINADRGLPGAGGRRLTAAPRVRRIRAVEERALLRLSPPSPAAASQRRQHPQTLLSSRPSRRAERGGEWRDLPRPGNRVHLCLSVSHSWAGRWNVQRSTFNWRRPGEEEEPVPRPGRRSRPRTRGVHRARFRAPCGERAPASCGSVSRSGGPPFADGPVLRRLR